MLHIKLHDRRPVGAGDLMGRGWVGYDPSLPVEDLFNQNRGRWILGSRADGETYAAFSYTGDHTVKFIAEIERLEPSDNKRVIEGGVLDSDHPLSRRWVGAPSPDKHRNPVTYFTE